MKFIEVRWHSAPLEARGAAANDLTNALDSSYNSLRRKSARSTPVNDDRAEASRARDGVSRRDLLWRTAAGVGAGLAALARPIAAGPTGIDPLADQRDHGCCPTRIAMPAGAGSPSLTDLATGNKQAMAVASRSRLAMAAHQAVLDIARGLPDEPIRRATLDVLANPSSRVHLASPSAADKAAVRQDLLDAGLISDSVPVEGIFPTIVDVDQAHKRSGRHRVAPTPDIMPIRVGSRSTSGSMRGSPRPSSRAMMRSITSAPIQRQSTPALPRPRRAGTTSTRSPCSNGAVMAVSSSSTQSPIRGHTIR